MAHEVKFTPHVIEPSFGIGRIMTGVFEHCFYVRPPSDAEGAGAGTGAGAAAAAAGAGAKAEAEDAAIARSVIAFPAIVAPVKAAVFALDKTVDKSVVARLMSALTGLGLSTVTDDSGVSIGRKYARVDEVGVPFAITVDSDTATTGQVTVRERDSTGQVYVPLAEAPGLVRDLAAGLLSWPVAMTRYAVRLAGVPLLPAAHNALVTGNAYTYPPPSVATAAAAPAAVAVAPPVPPTAAGAGASAATSAVPGGTAAPREALVVEGLDRASGRFARPKEPILP
jgi:glycyl-tRNA synthetase